ncbi:MAG: DegQ family serine endoprotease, partial [Rickettsiales bacterium]
MSKFRLISTALFFAFIAPVSMIAASSPSSAQEHPASFADLVDKLSPAVVNISTTQKVKTMRSFMGSPFQGFPDSPETDPFREFFERFGNPQGMEQPQDREVNSLGSGFIIEADGYVITNNHVVDDAEEITITLPDRSKYKAEIIGRDKKTDLALLKVDTKKPLPFVPLGDSDSMRVGDWVIAIGNPFGLGGSVTQGIISARQRSINSGPFDDFLQTDASINRGNSGGPLFNTKGEVIGINSAIFSPSMGGGSVGIGFAIPTALAKPVIEQLKEFGRTHRGWLGVKIQEVSEEIANSLGMDKPIGALVLEVAKDSPAAKAGITVGDVITSFNDKEVTEMRHLPRMVAETKSGKTVPFTYWHKNASKTGKITISEMDEESEQAQYKKDGKTNQSKNDPDAETLLGMEVTTLTTQLRIQLRLDKKATGLAVLNVNNGSEASQRGLQRGDLIIEANNEAVKSVADFKKVIKIATKSGRKFILVKISRNGEEAFITLPVGI